MTQEVGAIVVAGHICLDIVPKREKIPSFGRLPVPGVPAKIGGGSLVTGGTVAYTGIALRKLGLLVLQMAVRSELTLEHFRFDSSYIAN